MRSEAAVYVYEAVAMHYRLKSRLLGEDITVEYKKDSVHSVL